MTPSFPNEAMPEEALYTLLCKYLLDEAGAEERAWVEAWKHNDPGNAVLLASLAKVLAAGEAGGAMVPANTDAAWLQLVEKMDDPPLLAPARPAKRFTWLKIAAVLLAALGAGWWFFIARQPQQTFTGPVTAALADGSSVQLSAASRLEVARGFNSRSRKVTLTGTGTFDVKGSAALPFVVILGHTEVKVLGTRFTITYQPAAAMLKVHVSSGRVLVTDPDKPGGVVLMPRMLLQKDSGRPAFRITAHVNDMGKRDLSFTDTPLEEVLHTITEVYDIKVEVVNTGLLKATVRGNFTGESAEDVIRSLATLLGARYEKVNDRQYRLK
jgi:ferric-dicitrate binding protein FerR (iron transport regulator)